MKYKVTTIYNTVRFPLMPNEIRNALRDRFGGYDFDVEVDKDEARIKELEEQVKEMRNHDNCKHRPIWSEAEINVASVEDEPCLSCRGYSNWQPKQEAR